MLLSAILGSYAARSVHVPKVIGYLGGGLILRALLGWLVGPSADAVSGLELAAKPLDAINSLALGMILFSIGRSFEKPRLRAHGAQVIRVAILESASVLVLVFLGCGLVALLTANEHPLGSHLALALLLGVAGIATAPAATLFVLDEYDAKGPITNAILGVVGWNNVFCIVLFHGVFLVLASFGAIETSQSLGGHVWLGLLMTIVGSVAVGVLCGTLLSLAHAKVSLAETSLVFFAVLILLGAGQHWLAQVLGISFNFLLVSLITGAVFFNIALDSQKLESALHTVASPIFAGFFVMAGYNLHLGELVHLGWAGGAYVVCRVFGKIIGVRLGVRWAGTGESVPPTMGSALLCQAAVVIGLASFVEQNWHSDLARKFSTVILGSVAVFELIGPLLLKRCVVRGGEVKAITLIRRGGSAAGSVSVIRLTLRSLLRLFGLEKKAKIQGNGPIKVENLMRTNVQLLRADATLDEVLRFIERSTYNHFPVIDKGGDFFGVVHFADVRDVIYDPALRDLVTAADLADIGSKPVRMDQPIEDALQVFATQNVGVLAVVASADSPRVVGLLEQRDVLGTLHLESNTG